MGSLVVYAATYRGANTVSRLTVPSVKDPQDTARSPMASSKTFACSIVV